MNEITITNYRFINTAEKAFDNIKKYVVNEYNGDPYVNFNEFKELYLNGFSSVEYDSNIIEHCPFEIKTDSIIQGSIFSGSGQFCINDGEFDYYSIDEERHEVFDKIKNCMIHDAMDFFILATFIEKYEIVDDENIYFDEYEEY